MNAHQLFEACFDSACDFAEPTAKYVADYAEGAFNMTISKESAELIAAKKRQWDMTVEAVESSQNEFWYQVKKPLQDIEL